MWKPTYIYCRHSHDIVKQTLRTHSGGSYFHFTRTSESRTAVSFMERMSAQCHWEFRACLRQFLLWVISVSTGAALFTWTTPTHFLGRTGNHCSDGRLPHHSWNTLSSLIEVLWSDISILSENLGKGRKALSKHSLLPLSAQRLRWNKSPEVSRFTVQL